MDYCAVWDNLLNLGKASKLKLKTKTDITNWHWCSFFCTSQSLDSVGCLKSSSYSFNTKPIKQQEKKRALVSAVEKRTSLNQTVTKAHLPAETAYKSVGSFTNIQVLLWEIKIKQHINKPGIFHSRKQMSFTKQLILWQLDLKSGSSMGKK